MARFAMVTIAAAALLVGCAPGPPTSGDASPSPAGWDPETFLEERKQHTAEMLGISHPPEVDVVRLVDPLEQDQVWLSCLQEAGFDFSLAPCGGLHFPKEQHEELMESMGLAVYTCWQKYPPDPKYSAPQTEERLRWMYEYTTTTFLDCLRENGTPYEGSIPSEQVYIDSEGEWMPFTTMGEQYNLMDVQVACPQVPDVYWEQSFW